MSLGGLVLTYNADADNAEELHRRIREHIVPAARRAAGYQGFLLLDHGGGKRLAVVLFDSAEAAVAARAVVGPAGREHVHALLSSPTKGALGTVVVGDGIFGDADGSP